MNCEPLSAITISGTPYERKTFGSTISTIFFAVAFQSGLIIGYLVNQPIINNSQQCPAVERGNGPCRSIEIIC
jgi:hypothetical protein